MKQEILPNPFIFSVEIDSRQLFDLYEDDYNYMQEIFESSLHELEKAIPIIESSFYSGDLETLKRCAHKIKPVFGFTGLPKTQALFQEFEDVSHNYDSTESLGTFYIELQRALVTAKQLIMNEANKLKEYNNSLL